MRTTLEFSVATEQPGPIHCLRSQNPAGGKEWSSVHCSHSGHVIQAALLKVLKERTQKGPLRYVERISVEHVSLGNAPPALHLQL